MKFWTHCMAWTKLFLFALFKKKLVSNTTGVYIMANYLFKEVKTGAKISTSTEAMNQKCICVNI